MNNYIEKVAQKVNIEEGIIAIEQFLTTVYLEGPISNKVLARKLSLPIPLVTAMKKEFIKLGIVKQYKGISISEKGVLYVENHLGYKEIDKDLYLLFKNDDFDIESIFEKEIEVLEEIFDNRPEVDLSIDQAHCTCLTSIKRSLLTIKYDTLVNKKILCVGDDDLVSISIGLLLKKLYNNNHLNKTEIHVVDIDSRFLSYIEILSKKLGLPITCHHTDLREKPQKGLENSFDCFFSDPPYTLSGINLFLSRGINYLKNKKGLPIFFSYAHKSYDSSYDILSLLLKLGTSIHRIVPKFNHYIGASKIGNIGQLYVLHTTNHTKNNVKNNESFNGDLYTREVSTTMRNKITAKGSIDNRRKHNG